MKKSSNLDTIAAIATAAGAGGIGVIRISGPAVPALAERLLGKPPRPRHAHRVMLRAADGEIVDDGLLLYFPAPHSYTGEAVLELQGHGSPVVLGMVLQAVLAMGVRLARPGEFSERAFLNGKLDLAQAEAVADLIGSQSAAAARAAMRSLQGEFSRRVEALQQDLIELRLWIESAIDFPEEEIDFLADAGLHARAAALQADLAALLTEARRGQRLRDGLQVVILGPPNAGKSSLLNRLAGTPSAIVTEVAGTTRDVLREQIVVEGLAITLVDTAGLRESLDIVEQEGVRRARLEASRADLALLLLPWDAPELELLKLRAELPEGLPSLQLRNKMDLAPADWAAPAGAIALSALTGAGIDDLRQALLRHAGLGQGSEGSFSARARHVAALERVLAAGTDAWRQLQAGHGELAAADLLRAQDDLSTLTGRYTPDDLLGEIFGRFCIGK